MKNLVYVLILAVVFLLGCNCVKEGYSGKYILKSKIIPPVCPKCPDVVNNCNDKEEQDCPPCQPCGRCPEVSHEQCKYLFKDLIGFHTNKEEEEEEEQVFVNERRPRRRRENRFIPDMNFGHQARFNDDNIDYKKQYDNSSGEEPMAWLNSFSAF